MYNTKMLPYTLEMLRRREEEKMLLSQLLLRQQQLENIFGSDRSFAARRMQPTSFSLGLLSMQQPQPHHQHQQQRHPVPTFTTAQRCTSPSESLSSKASASSEKNQDVDDEQNPLVTKSAESKQDDSTFFSKHNGENVKDSFSKQETFPLKLYRMLYEAEKNGEDDIVSFLPSGKSFLIHDIDKFVEKIIPRYFTSPRMASFQRQLNLYGFRRRLRGEDRGAYFHSDFRKGKRNLALTIKRKVQAFKIPPHFLTEQPEPIMRPSNNVVNFSAGGTGPEKNPTTIASSDPND